MKIAIVHDYLIDFGGAERVLLALHEIYPDAPIYTLIDRRKSLGHFENKFSGTDIRQSWFGKIPFAEKLISPLRFLLPLLWKGVNLKEYDLIISSASWAITKGFDKKTGAIEICYCHTPPRFLYGFDTSRRFGGFFGKLVKIYAKFVNGPLRKYDYKRAQKVDYFIANSREVAGRIKRIYNRDSVIIYPPVEIENYRSQIPSSKIYYLAGGRLTVAKNFDLIIKAFNKLGKQLLIFGDGPQKDYLKNIAGENINFLGEVDDETITRLYQGARAYIVAQKDEDFGITPVEAIVVGTPVIAFKGGGYLETIIDGKTGIFFNELTAESLLGTIKKFEKSKFSPNDLVNHAKKFSQARFKKEITEFINKHA